MLGDHRDNGERQSQAAAFALPCPPLPPNPTRPTPSVPRRLRNHVLFHLPPCTWKLQGAMDFSPGALHTSFIQKQSADILLTQLLAVSLLTLITLTLTILFYFCRALNPFFNMTLNIGLCVLWALSWSLLTWYMSGTLLHKCNTKNWKDDSGTMVCRIYKALFSFALLGLYVPLPLPPQFHSDDY